MTVISEWEEWFQPSIVRVAAIHFETAFQLCLIGQATAALYQRRRRRGITTGIRGCRVSRRGDKGDLMGYLIDPGYFKLAADGVDGVEFVEMEQGPRRTPA